MDYCGSGASANLGRFESVAEGHQRLGHDHALGHAIQPLDLLLWLMMKVEVKEKDEWRRQWKKIGEVA